VRVVADSHTLIWYLFGDPDQRLSQTAREALEEAENTDGIAVSVASILDIWYVTQTRQVLSTEQLAGIVELLNDPAQGLEAVPITMPVATAFQEIPLVSLRDPWDRLITATAKALDVPLVTRDDKIRNSELVETIW
jgi:PIN domain nuclease of toxin-antitoxin system